MKILYAKRFERDIEGIRQNLEVKKRLLEVIEKLKALDSLDELRGIKKIEGYASYYRIRVGDYRLGFKVAKDALEMIRFLHRKDIYRRFP